MPTRLKGLDTIVTFVSQSTGTEESVADVKSFEVQFDRDILSEGYLGQLTEQKDDQFKGISGKMEFHFSSADVLDLIQRINDVTKRRVVGERFEIVSTLNFPDLSRRRIIIPNPKFGAIPITTGSRDDFVAVTFDFQAEDAQIIAA